MSLKFATLAFACLSSIAASKLPLKRNAAELDQLQPQATGFAAATTEPVEKENLKGATYFQYMHMPGHNHYQHGHKRGNFYHFVERHEKAHPYDGLFQAKVRWGDKHGGYGEQLWDLQHAGHNNDEASESQNQESYDYDETNPAPALVYQPVQQAQVAQLVDPAQAAQFVQAVRGKRNPDEDVEFIDDNARREHNSGRMPKHGGNYRRLPEDDYFRAKRHQDKGKSALYLDASSGLIVDEATGERFTLTPVWR